MKTHAKRGAIVAVALALLTLGAVALTRAPRLLAGSTLAELPDPPFSKIPDDFPRIIPVREAPSRDDQGAFAAYQTSRREVWKYLTEGGVIGRATPEEREAVVAALDDKYTRAKSLGLKILGRDQDSLAALYAVAVARVSGDANLPDGLFLIRRARRIAERRGLANPGDADAREWYLRILWFEYSILVDLNRNEEAIRAVEILERLYEPLPRLKVWALFKLHRLEDADAMIKQAEQSGRYPRSSANDRLALEGLRFHRVEQLDAAHAACRIDADSPVIWSNTGEAALSCLLHSESEQAYLQAAKIAERIGRTRYSGSPFTPLSRLYLQQGRTAEALDSLARARVQRAQRDAGTLADDQGDYETSVALAMLALGRTKDAERFARRVVETPDRIGHTSERPDDKSLTNAVILWTILSAQRADEAEKAGRDWTTPETGAEAWAAARLASRIARQGDRPNVLRPFVPGSATIASWQLGSILRMVPHGVALAMVDQARQEETLPAAAPYFDALEAEARLIGNDPAGALAAARKALDQLPKPGETLLRGRTAAIAAEAARQLGRNDESRGLWSAALVDFPAAPRLLGLAIPVKIEAGSDSQDLVDLLARSPRFRVEPWGLPLRVNASSGRVAAALLRGDGSTHAELTEARGSTTTTPEMTGIRDRFLDLIAAPTIRLSEIDVNALDGLPNRGISEDEKAAIATISPNK